MHSVRPCIALNVVRCEESVNLQGVNIDIQLNFDEHISNVCKIASRQLNVFKRIGGHLCKLGKLHVYKKKLCPISSIAR